MQTLSHSIGVIGTASFDTLHVAGSVIHTIGGAGLYTALAAYRAGVNAHLIAPRPESMPPLFVPVTQRLHWTGPIVPPEGLPRLEIEHHGQGQATLRHAAWGAEAELTPSALTMNQPCMTIAHIAALSSAQRQLEFVQGLRTMGKRETQPRISVGTYYRLIDHEMEVVQQLFRIADCFFMNQNEAQGLFGTVDTLHTRVDALLYVTLGDQGAFVVEGDCVTHVPAHPVDERDPTGAGDTFCGATLAGLAMGLTPVEAAARAVDLAAQTVSDIGPAALLA